jgi:hypothetical protein
VVSLNQAFDPCLLVRAERDHMLPQDSQYGLG